MRVPKQIENMDAEEIEAFSDKLNELIGEPAFRKLFSTLTVDEFNLLNLFARNGLLEFSNEECSGISLFCEGSYTSASFAEVRPKK